MFGAGGGAASFTGTGPLPKTGGFEGVRILIVVPERLLFREPNITVAGPLLTSFSSLSAGGFDGPEGTGTPLRGTGVLQPGTLV